MIRTRRSIACVSAWACKVLGLKEKKKKSEDKAMNDAYKEIHRSHVWAHGACKY
jgi:hypothetical protein